jgi:hypothetical protein
MTVKIVEANPLVREDIGKAAVMRGPIVYCLEECDNGAQLQQIYINANQKFSEKYEADLLNGVVTLTTTGKRLSDAGWNGDMLYRTYTGKTFEDQELKLIPYYSWANRGIGEMTVWVRTE